MSPNPRRANSVRSLLDALISSRYLDGPAEGDAHAVSRALGQAEVTRALTVSSPRDIAAKRELYQRNRANPQQWENFNDRVSGRTSLLPSRPREQPAHRNVPPPAPTPAPLHISPPWTLARRPGLNTPWVTTGGTSTIRVPDEARLVLEGAERDFQISVAASPLVTGYRVREECYQGSAGGQFMVVRRIHSPSIDGGRFTRSEPMVSGQAFFYNASLDRMEALPQYNERQHSFPWLSGGTGIDPRSPQRIVYRVLNVADAARLRSNPGMAIRAADPGNGIVTPHIHVSRARGYESSPYISATRDLNTAIQWASAANCTGCMVVAIDLSRIAPQFQNSNNIVDLTNPSIREAQVFGAFPRNFAEASAEVLLKDSDRNQPLLPANAYDIVFDTLLPHTTPLNVTREQMLGEVTRNQSNY